MLSDKTISFIMKLLNVQVNITKQRMMDAIDNGSDQIHVDNGVKQYREAKAAAVEFCDWVDDEIGEAHHDSD